MTDNKTTSDKHTPGRLAALAATFVDYDDSKQLSSVTLGDVREALGLQGELARELQRAIEMIEEANRRGASQIVPASMRAAIAKATGAAA